MHCCQCETPTTQICCHLKLRASEQIDRTTPPAHRRSCPTTTLKVHGCHEHPGRRALPWAPSCSGGSAKVSTRTRRELRAPTGARSGVYQPSSKQQRTTRRGRGRAQSTETRPQTPQPPLRSDQWCNQAKHSTFRLFT